MAYKSLRAQNARMRAAWPGFRVVAESEWFIVWEGPMRTLFREYRVRIQLIKPTFTDYAFIWGGVVNPKVWVLEPALELRPGATRLPHTYVDPVLPPERAPLCLFFWKDDEWTQAEYIADAIVPWAAEWLHFYEGWHVTGEWHGGGIHPGDEEYQEWQERTRQRDLGHRAVQPGQYRRSADNFVGRKTGTFASFALMAAASKGSLRPPSSLDWKRLPWADDRSPSTSTWLQVRPRAASSH